MKRFLALSLLLLPASAWATTTVSGTLQNLGTIPVGQNAFVRFWLRGCSGNQPRVNGTPVIAPSSGGVFFFDLVANVSGYVTGTIYSTRDSTGLLGRDIECGCSKTAVWYGMQIFVAGKGGPEIAVHARNGATLDLSNITPLSTNPVATAPTGDSTYCRLDGGNGTCNVATSAISFPGVPTGSCTPVQTAVNTLTGDFYSCVGGGAWLKVGPGAAGTLSSPIATPNPLGFNVDTHLKGPNPWVDVTTYGARSANPNVTPQVPGITATMSGGSATAILSSASTFQRGDSVAIQAAGASCTLATPTGVTVTPSVATGPTGTNVVATSPAGSATRSYKVVARGTNQCLTAASTTATTTTGQTLGSNTLGTISCTRANDVMTCTTPSPHTMVARSGSTAGTWLFQSGFTDPSFTGWFEVVTVPDNTHYTLGPGLLQDTRLGYAASVSGGTVWWHNCDRIAWSVVTGAYEYAVYEVTSTPKLIGVSKPQNVNYSNGTDLGYLILDNYGSPMMDGSGHKLPWFWPSTPPSVSVPATLVTTIVSGAGTTTITLANTATNAVAGTAILFDNALNILTAANAAAASGSLLHFPGNSFYVTNSYLTLPNFLSISQQGSIVANDTIQVTFANWSGSIIPPSGVGKPSFALTAGTSITGTGRPLLYDSNGNGGSNWYGLAIQPYPNGWGLIQENSFDTYIYGVNFFTKPTADNDYMGIGLEFRGATNGSDAVIDTALFSASMPQTNGSTSTPYLFFNQYGLFRMDRIEFNRRGIAIRAPTSATISGELNFSHAQGEVTPFITAMETVSGGNSGNLILTYIETDTSIMPLYSGAGPLLNVALINTLIEGQSSDTAGVPPQTSGQKAATSNLTLSNNTIGVNGTGEIGFLMPTPAAPTVAISGGSGPAANTYTYYLIAYDALGGNTFASPGSAPITVNGSQGVLVSWPLLSGQVATTICRSTGGSPACGSVGGFKVGGTSFLDNGTFFPNNSVPTSSTAISVGAGSVGVMPGSSTVASLPAAASGNAGLVRTVIDSTAVAVEGQTCVGGGTVTALAFSNGTVWKCF